MDTARPSRLPAAALLSLFLLLPTCSLDAASTGASALFTVQGSGTTSDNGDYITATLDQAYHYFIEVPPGLPRLLVEIFDADIGAGGAAEATATPGRDRARTGFNTKASYTLISPHGARLTNFASGDATTPAGADNAWLTFFDATDDTFEDDFGTAAYTNQDGTIAWATDWTETNDDNSATAGQILITGGRLRIRDNGGAVSTIEREANLSANGFTTATLSFDVQVTGATAGTDRMNLDVSANGGTSWTTLETFNGNVATAHRTYNITSSIATNTRIRFIRNTGYNGTGPSFFADNVQISRGSIESGHWELIVDESSAVTAGGDINAFGIRASDGTGGAGGTEINIYQDSQAGYGINPPATGTLTRTYPQYLLLTNGCAAAKNDFDFDSNSGNVGSIALTSRSGAYTTTFPTTSMSANNVWRRDTFTGWTTDNASTDYGIWQATTSINTYNNGAINGNYGDVYFSTFAAAANPPTANPTANAFRIYLPTDAGAAPVKPYLEQLLTWGSGPNPPVSGSTTLEIVSIRVVNPTAQAITFSAANLVRAFIPGGTALYAGSPLLSQGAIVTQPVVGGSGNLTWNPGTVAAGTTALLAFRVNLRPTAAGQRVPATATPASGNGTRATFLDETANTTQARATYTAGPVCEVAVTAGIVSEAVVSSFGAYNEAGAVVVEWKTASEEGTVGYELYRFDTRRGDYVRLNEGLLAGLLGAPQGGTYRFVDASASAREPQRYMLVEVEAKGERKNHGPFDVYPDWSRTGAAPKGPFSREEHPRSALVKPATARQAALPGLSGLQPTSGGAARIAVRDTGLQYLTAAETSPALGLTTATVQSLLVSGGLSLTRGGQPVAWFADSASKTNPLGFYFYGEATDSVYTLDNVYRLERATGVRMVSAAVTAAGATSGGAFTATQHSEKDLFPATLIAANPDADYWYWDFVVGGDPTDGSKTFSLDAPSLAAIGAGAGTTSLTVALQSATTTGIAQEHHAQISLNGTPIGDTSWQGIAAQTTTFPVDPSLLQATGNQVSVAGLLDADVPYSIFYVDSFDLAYSRLYKAGADALAFPSATTPITVGGFSATNVSLLDISNPSRPLFLTGSTVTADPANAGTYRLSLGATTAGKRYLAAGPGGVKHPYGLRPWSATGLSTPGRHADYLVIAATDLKVVAKHLTSYRQGQGLDAQLVGLDEVGDEFGGGVASPRAVQAFLTYVRDHWSPAPRYVALLGAGSLDYRNLLGFGDSLFPPFEVASPDGLFASDSQLAPTMAVGRIPVHTAADLSAYIDKLIAFEGGAPAAWDGTALLLADEQDRGADFTADSERVASVLGGITVTDRIYLSTTPLAAAHSRLLQDLATGATWVDYLGHGGMDRLAAGGLLSTSDVATLANGGRLPILTAMTCTVNRFDVPGVPALGELLTATSGVGAIAVWSPSGLAVTSESRLLAERLYLHTADLGLTRLGDLLLAARADFHALGGADSTLNVYNLLGDPALRLRRAAPSPVQPGGGSGGRE